MSATFTTAQKLEFATAIRCTAVMFQETVADHPLAPKVRDDVSNAWAAIGALFNVSVTAYHQALEHETIDFVPRPQLWQPSEEVIPTPGPDDEPVEITEGHYLEIMDRASCIDLVFDRLVVKHPVAELFPNEVERAADLVAELYQQAAKLTANWVESE